MLSPSMKVAVFLQRIYDALLQPPREHHQIIWDDRSSIDGMPNGSVRRP